DRHPFFWDHLLSVVTRFILRKELVMKKVVFRLSLSLVALGLLAAPAMAASSPALSLADQAFVASLAVQAGAPAPVDAAKRPAIGLKSMCTANCWNGGTVSCSGT